jgi:hypothetical protein
MRHLWKGIGERPNTSGLHESVAAEVLLCTGVLTGWIGNKIQIKDAQEIAKNLIGEAISYFESMGVVKKVAAARVELAYCYWRDGEFNEARIMLQEAIQRLTTEGHTRAKAILKLTTIEWTGGHYFEALTILNTTRPFTTKLLTIQSRARTIVRLQSCFATLPHLTIEVSIFNERILAVNKITVAVRSKDVVNLQASSRLGGKVCPKD